MTTSVTAKSGSGLRVSAILSLCHYYYPKLRTHTHAYAYAQYILQNHMRDRDSVTARNGGGRR